jgi:hypothetical protein
LRQIQDDSRGMIWDLEPDTSRMIVTFASARGHRVLGVRPFAFQSLLSDVDIKVTMLRDHWEIWYHRGVMDVGKDIQEVADRLREWGSEVCDEMIMLGGCAGATAAVYFGSLLGCETYAFTPQSFLSPELRRVYGDRRWQLMMKDLLPHLDRRFADMVPVLADAASRNPKPVHMWWGAQHQMDTIHVQRMADFDHVFLHPVDSAEHNVGIVLRDRGELKPLLMDMLDLKLVEDASEPAPA